MVNESPPANVQASVEKRPKYLLLPSLLLWVNRSRILLPTGSSPTDDPLELKSLVELPPYAPTENASLPAVSATCKFRLRDV